MANRNQYRGRGGRFERCTVEKLFGLQTNPGRRYRCTKCGHVFMPILASGICSECGSSEKVLIEIKDCSRKENEE